MGWRLPLRVAMVPALLLLLLLLLLVPLAAPQVSKCSGPCTCKQLPPEDAAESFGVLVNCSGVAPDAGGAVPVPSPAALQVALRGAAFVRLSFAGCGAERLLPLQAPGDAELRALDLSDNALAALLDHALQAVRADLRLLRLDGNRLQELEGDVLRPLRVLRDLDVSRNPLKALDLGALPPSLLRLRAAHCLLEELLPPSPPAAAALELQELDLSGNALASLERQALAPLGQLRALRLEGNALRALDGAALSALPLLRTLDVSRCGLRALRLERHGALKRLRAADNALTAAEAALVAAALPALQHLDLSRNGLQAFPLRDVHLTLQVLNLSGNALSWLPEEPPLLPSLEVLDASSNALAALPPTLGAPALPALRHLYLDGNAPLTRLQLRAPLPLLRTLSATRLPLLRALRQDDLQGLRGDAPPSCVAPGGEDTAPGTVLRLAHNPMLADIDEAALQGLPLCEVDLSGCALTAVPEKALDWERMRAVDLQGNPLHCSCALQWLVDRIVKPLYDSNRKQLLYELRCATPAELRGRRLVHFYDWKDALCSPRQTLERLQAPEASQREYSLSAGRGMLIALCAVGALFVGTVLAGLSMHYQALQRRRRQNRRA